MPTVRPPLRQDTAPPHSVELRPRGLASLMVLGPEGLWPRMMRSACLVLALMQMWMSRGILDPDGVSYSDLAKALLRGDWRNGLSSYWSPLYSWFLLLGYAVFRPGIHWPDLRFARYQLPGFRLLAAGIGNGCCANGSDGRARRRRGL